MTNSWRGKIIGVAEYNNNPNNHIIVLKIETGQAADYFVGFNRAVHSNKDVVQAHNQVTVYKVQEGDGLAYSHSSLKATLFSGQRATINNWRGSSQALNIKVHEINTNVEPGYADVEITYGTPMPTRQPTKNPTLEPTKKPTREPTKNPTREPTEPTKKPTKNPTTKPTANPTNEVRE